MRRSNQQRGSVLAMAIILLAVLAFIGVTAISVSSQERNNATYASQYDRLLQCANAAQAQLYGEIAAFGTGYLKGGAVVTAINLPDGTKLVAPAHATQAAQLGTLTVNQVVLGRPQGAAGGVGVVDMTNRSRSAQAGGAYTAVAYCSDPKGRSFEVEFDVRFAL